MKSILLALLALFLLCKESFSAANQSLNCGDGQVRWEIVTTYFLGAAQVGVQTNALDWASDSNGLGLWMDLDKEVWTISGPTENQLFSSYTSFNVFGGNGIIWSVDFVSPWDFFAGLYDSQTTTSTITWFDHTGVKSATASTTNPDVYEHAVWLDWSKQAGAFFPRITFGAKPKNFNRWLSDGSKT